ncbi:MAG: ASKHA domain-containing protein [Gammaproteobacteria bacterium]|nr:ASKHA domain-containing protein [Gammaproteobacteria bacterium]
MTRGTKVVFLPSGKRGEFEPGTTLLHAAQTLNVDLDSVCGGRAMCGRCQILCAEGEFAKHGISSRHDHLSARGAVETQYDEQYGLAAGRRLACQTRLLDDAVIDVPADSQVHRQVVRKQAGLLDLDLFPMVRLHYVEVPEPNMHNPEGDLTRLKLALEFEWGMTELSCDVALVRDLQKVLRKGEWRVTVAVYNDRDIIALWPGFHDRIYGAAIDVGSTTVAVHLCELTDGRVLASSGAMNPQIRYGEDLMSRVSYVMMNPGGDRDMTNAVRETISRLITEVAMEVGADPHDVLDITFVGNPVMHHLLLGIDPVELGGAPFALATDESVATSAATLNLDVNPDARVYVLPCIAGHVGADAAAMVLSARPYNDEAMTLLVDVGTNAEIVLGNRDRLVACSSPTGPAFEGAQISGGQRAAPGAIDRVRIDPETLEPRVRVIGCEDWSDSPAFAASETKVTGICGSGIIEVIAEMYLAGILSADGIIKGELAERSSRVFPHGRTFSYLLYENENVRVVVTQNDVRQIQLAKAALYAGVRLLMDRMRVDSVDRIKIAGAFGNNIDTKYAMVLGLIPDCDLDNVFSVGNAAGDGARMALMDRNAREEIEHVVKRIHKIETAVEPKFQEHFVKAMAIPHKTDPFPELRKRVALPDPEFLGGEDTPDRPRRRRRVSNRT